MKYIIDIETDDLKANKLWCVVLKCIDTGVVTSYTSVSGEPSDFTDFKSFLDSLDPEVTTFVGHNVISFDLPTLQRLLDYKLDEFDVIDTLVVAKTLNYDVDGGNSLAAWGERLGVPKTDFHDFSHFSPEMLAYCIQDVNVTGELYALFLPYIESDRHKPALRLEHQTARLCVELRENGFYFDIEGGLELHRRIREELDGLDRILQVSFPPVERLVRNIRPRRTKTGAFNRNDFRFLTSNQVGSLVATGAGVLNGRYDLATSAASSGILDLSAFNGDEFTLWERVPFNPGSPKQCVERLWEFGWEPYEKTKGHLQCERTVNSRFASKQERENANIKLADFRVYGWKLSEANLNTLQRVEPLKEWKETWRINLSKPDVNTSGSIIDEILKRNELKPGDIITVTKNTIGTKGLNVLTELVSKLIESYTNDRTVAVEFVEKTNHLWLITATPQGIFVDCSAPFATDTWVGLRDTGLLQKRISGLDAAHKLVRWLMLDARRSTLEEWFGAYNHETHRIHGNFNHIGAWTGRMSHTAPNMANIPGHGSVFGDEMRSLWQADPGEYLVGVDADGIQLRIFAHYINDPDFIKSIVSGSKSNGTDAHSLNQRALGPICKDRDTAKTFIYAFLLGAGIGKVAQILGCTAGEARDAVEKFLSFYPGLRGLKDYAIPADAARGYFIGFDGRVVLCDSEHHMLAGYLQNGEAVIMKTANQIWRNSLKREGIIFRQANFVHDEWQNRIVTNDLTVAERAGTLMVQAIEETGDILKLRCPLTGNAKIGRNWLDTH